MELVIKFLRRKCSPIGEQRVFQCLENPADIENLEKLMKKHWENTSISDSFETDYSRLLGKIHQWVFTPINSRIKRYQSIALRSLKVADTLFFIIFTKNVSFELQGKQATLNKLMPMN